MNQRKEKEQGMKTKKLYLSGSVFAIAQKCPASLTIEFSKKLMEEREDHAEAGTDEHARIAADIESVRRFLPARTPGLVEHIEDKLQVSFGAFQLSGGPDYYAYNLREGSLHVVDWKTGPAGVDHLGPAQIEFYAFLILQKMTTAARSRIKNVYLSLVSPRLNQQKKYVRTAEQTLRETAEKLKLIERSTKRGEKPRPGEQCRFCNKRFVCVQLRDELKRFADPEVFGTDGVRKEKMQKLTAEDLKTLSIAAAAIADIRHYAVELCKNGAAIPGTRVEIQNAARVFSKDVDAAMVAKALGVRTDTVCESKLKTPAQLEKSGVQLTPEAAQYIITTTREVLKVETAGKTETKKTKKGEK